MAKKKEVKNKEQENKPSKKETKKKQNKQIMWAIILMIGMILIIIGVPFIVKNYVNKFEYINLEWQKTRLGDLKYYSTRIPIADKQGNIIASYSMNFKNDPRKLDNVNVNLSAKDIGFIRGKPVYIALAPEMKACGANNSIAISDLSGFLRHIAGLELEAAWTDSNVAKKNNLSYVTCKNTLKNTVIYINSGNETRINRVGDNCYEIIYNNCEILPATEKFMLIIMENYMNYFTKKDTSFLDMFK